MARRVLCVWFPHLAAELALRRSGEARLRRRPFATVRLERGAWRLSSVDPAAARLGLAPGQTLADARATTPELRTAPDWPERVAMSLEGLGRWALRYTPLVARDAPDGLSLDITGCAHLFGGEAALAAAMLTRLETMGLTARAGAAETKGAAWALAHFGEPKRREASIAPTGGVGAAVGDLPVSALRIEQDAAACLMRVGLGRIADIAAIPRAALSRRFGPAAARRLDQLFGVEPEPLTPVRFRKPYAVRLHLPEPIGLTADLRAGLERVLAALCARLEREGRGARTLRLSVQRCDGGGAAAEIGLARPSHDPRRIAPLFDAAIETIDAGFGIDALRLEALTVEALAAPQEDVFAAAKTDHDLSDLISQIGNRIGFERVLRFIPDPSHNPERAFRRAPAAHTPAAGFSTYGPARPLRLFPPEPLRVLSAGAPPDRFRWRGAEFDTAGAVGPERIAPEWWREDPAWGGGPRDYWRVQTAGGRRLWLFHTPKPQASAEAAADAWFAQGEFA